MGKAVNIFKISLGDDPKEVLNWRLGLAVLSFGLMGCARGIDEGLITGTFSSSAFQEQLGILDLNFVDYTNIKGNITAMLQMGSIFGALIAFLICDRVGRVWATRQLCFTWIAGIVIFLANGGNIAAVYAGRFIAGIGVGETVVVGPIYLAETAPAAIRGLCTCAFTGSVYVGIMLAYFANYGARLHMADSYNQWAVPTALHIIFAGLVLVLSCFQLESPRYLIRSNKHDEALQILSRLRALPVDRVRDEFNAIEASYKEEMKSKEGCGFVTLVREMFMVRTNLYRLSLLAMTQVLCTWSGGGAITLYAPDIFDLLGVHGKTKLMTAAVFGVVKLVSAVVCAFFLVDVIGRKRSLMSGITLQAVSLAYFSSFLTVVFVGGNLSAEPPEGHLRAGYAAVVSIFVSGVGWALGWNSAQYLLTAELFPLHIRAACSSLVMAVHFANQYGTSRALPNMMLDDEGIAPHGAFWFFTAMTVLGGFFVWFCLPEAAGLTLEKTDRLFKLPWYKIGLYGKKIADEPDEPPSGVLGPAVSGEQEEDKEKVGVKARGVASSNSSPGSSSMQHSATQP